MSLLSHKPQWGSIPLKLFSLIIGCSLSGFLLNACVSTSVLKEVVKNSQEEIKACNLKVLKSKEGNQTLKSQIQELQKKHEEREEELKVMSAQNEKLKQALLKLHLIDSINNEQIQYLVKDSRGVSQVKGELVIANFDGIVITLHFRQSSKILIAQMNFRGNIELKILNEWNRKQLFSRAYQTHNDRFILENELDFKAGVTLSHLRLWFARLHRSTRDFKEFLNTQHLSPRNSRSRPRGERI